MVISYIFLTLQQNLLSTTFESEITDLTVHKLSKKDLLKTLKKECIIYNQQ